MNRFSKGGVSRGALWAGNPLSRRGSTPLS